MKAQILSRYALYLAIFLVMGLTPNIGYIKIGVIEVTLMCIPLVVITMHLGWKGAIFGGFCFGLTSFVTAFTLGSSLVGILGIANWFVVALIPRILVGLILAGIILVLPKICKKFFWKTLIVAIFALLINHFAFLTFYFLLAHESFKIIFSLVWINTLIEWPAVIIISTALSHFIKYVQEKEMQHY